MLLASGLAATAITLNPSTHNDGAKPTYTVAEVAKRDGGPASGGKMWVTYGAGVYDITEFVASHPGGAAKIALAAGKSLEPFWHLFPFHFQRSKEEPWKHLLDSMLVGRT